ncbi:TonB-dependent receptor [Bryobacter aggregatus]|uniref:TonB-dependent receptor n=1 Tax=Bryobacter aggregatus TaxID=360054 RepID=UPI0004E231AC|nr:carboxypeptidase regulatory-like domain-containing protein [Bryobacter aggregatus]
MKHQRNSQLAQYLLGIVLLAAPAWTQPAELSGFVRDTTGAAVANARLTIRNLDTNVQLTVSSNGLGIYNLPSLPPGRYELSVEAVGFQKQIIEDIKLEVAAKVAREILLPVGSLSQAMTVNGSGININTVDASVSTVIDRHFVENMPLNGRSFQSLLTLVPGVTAVVSSRGTGQSGAMSVNGQRTESNYFTVDGVSANTGASPSTPGWGAGYGGSTPGETALGTTQSLVSVDALQEFRATTSTYSAEYGRGPGGQFSFTTRSGTNGFHGSLFNYFRNDALDANNFFSNATGTQKPKQRQNDFGGTLGGPLHIPKLYNGKDRTFFFFSYEGLRLRTPQPAVVTDVPSLAMRANAPVPLRVFLNAFPLPNGPETVQGLASFTGVWSNPGSINSSSLRMDHSITDTFKVFGRYSDAPSESITRSTSNMARSTSQLGSAKTLTLGATNIFSARANNELRFNLTRNGQGLLHTLDNFGGATPLKISAIPGYSNSDQHWVDIYLQWGLRPSYALNSKRNLQQQINLTDSFSLSLGRHNLKAGIDYRRLATQQASPSLYQFALYNTYTELMANTAPNVTLERFSGDVSPIYTNFSAFLQDEWKINSRLSLSLGLRWDVNPPPSDSNGNIPYNLDQTRNLATAKMAPAGTPLWNTRWNNLAPRIGLAYHLRQSNGWDTVLRLGSGLFYDTTNTMASHGYFGVGLVGALRFLNVGSAFPVSADQIAQLPVGSIATPYNFSVYAINRDIKSPYTMQWSAAVEQGIGQNQTLTLNYIGSATRQLPVAWTYNAAAAGAINPDFKAWGLYLTTNGANASYHGLQAQFQRRISRGLQATAFYTWSHTIDDATNNFGVSKLLRGNSDYDIRHNFQSAITYELPGRYSHSWLNAAFAHWATDTRISARSGMPVDILGITGVDPTLGTSVSYQPNLVAGQPLYISDKAAPGGRRINFAAFSTTVVGTHGNLGRNVANGFGTFQTDIAIRRQFQLSERFGLQFRGEAFNVFNHPVFGSIYNQLSSGAARFGLAYNTQNTQMGGLNSLYQTGGPRSVQLALKLIF